MTKRKAWSLISLFILVGVMLGAVSQIDLVRQVKGILPAANGGTGVNSTATYPSSGTVMITTTSASCAQQPALTGNVTSSAGSCATTVASVPINKGGMGTSALTPGTTVSVDFSLGTVFTLTPAQSETINATNCTAGQQASIIITTSGTSSFTLTFSTNFKTTGTLATGTTTAKVFNISFRCNGSTATELARTAAM